MAKPKHNPIDNSAAQKPAVRHRFRPIAPLDATDPHASYSVRDSLVSKDASSQFDHEPANQNSEEGLSADPSEKEAKGYKNPPKKNQFQKGKSGNPSGRGKGNRNTKTMARDILNEKLTVTRDGKRKKVQMREAMMQVFRNKALSGDLKAAQFLMASAGETATPGEEPMGVALAAIEATDLAILAYHYRLALVEARFDDGAIETILAIFGLPGSPPPAETVPDAVNPPDQPSDESGAWHPPAIEHTGLP